MGKYVKKVSEANHAQESIGVRTRSKASAALSNGGGVDRFYLQLRNRRLEWRSPLVLVKPRKPINRPQKKGLKGKKKVGEKQENEMEKEEKEMNDEKIGENEIMELDASSEEGKERIARESTPENLIMTSAYCRTMAPPSSTTKSTLKNKTPKNNTIKNDTIDQEEMAAFNRKMEEIFTIHEKQSVERFIKKYNFDPVNDKPLPGRFEWEKIEP